VDRACISYISCGSDPTLDKKNIREKTFILPHLFQRVQLITWFPGLGQSNMADRKQGGGRVPESEASKSHPH
jgi:hypothetical protein